MLAFLILVVFVGGHLCVATAIFSITVGIFSELVAVGYSEANTDRTIPLYRSLQWAWFAVSMSAAYSLEGLNAPLDLADFSPKCPTLSRSTSGYLKLQPS